MGNVKQGDQIGTSDAHSIILGESLQKEIPGIESSATTTPAAWFKHFNVTSGATTIKATGNFASRDYFTVFPHNLLHASIVGFIKNKFPNADITLFIRKYSDQHLYGNAQYRSEKLVATLSKYFAALTIFHWQRGACSYGCRALPIGL
jgi:hypothetical protein